MTATLRYFPSSLQREDSLMFELMGVVVSGGQSLAGAMPLSRLDGGGLWKAALTSVSLRTADQVRTWRALTAICDGGAQPIIVPFCDKRYFPAPTVNGRRLTSLDDVPHSDDASFDDDTDYVSDVVEANMSVAAALRATAITIQIVAGSDLMGGEHFSIDHADLRWRLYRIATAVDNGDGTFACSIRPPLRAAVEADTPLQFDRPKCVMQLATPDAMDLVLQQRKFGRPTVQFREAFPPFPT